MKNLSIVIPVFNEASSLKELLCRTTAACEPYSPYEIICVDDGSWDGSFELLLELKKNYEHLVIVRLQKNSGQSAALTAGFKTAHGSIIVMMDADLQNPPEAIPTLLENMDGFDAVIGWRKDRKDSFLKRAGSRIGNSLRRMILRDPFHDNACSLKAFKSAVAADLVKFNHMIFFLPDLIEIAGYRIKEVPVPHEHRKHGRSKYRTFSLSGISSFWDTLFVKALKKRKLTYTVERIIA